MGHEEIAVPGAVPEGLRWVTVQLGWHDYMDLLSELRLSATRAHEAGDTVRANRLDWLGATVDDYATHYTSTGPVRIMAHVPEEGRTSHRAARSWRWFGWFRRA